ncbi:potassium channel family protein [Streptomyces aidingensis]|uniref:Ion channel n=1 Tax=Streptomyces aidingensis TaxID=910347 RepID=A0A1I1LNM8_9ACTN|nr:potassium channel family protein [Streptomyces aidingensis]SFC74556.1 Ion channel [Streptomyces aidingensis]
MAGRREGRGPDPARRADRRSALAALARSALNTTGLLLAYFLLPMDEDFGPAMAAVLALGLLAVAALLVWQTRAIVRSPRPRLRAVEALSVTVPVFLLLFATVYYMTARSEPGAFTEPLSRTDALYFTLTVFATVGFGDITPVTQPARVATMVQMAGGLLFVGVVARVVLGAVESGLARRREPGRPDPGG